MKHRTDVCHSSIMEKAKQAYVNMPPAFQKKVNADDFAVTVSVLFGTASNFPKTLKSKLSHLKPGTFEFDDAVDFLAQAI